MSRWTPTDIIGGAYSDNDRAWSVQDTLNLIPVYTEKEGTRTPKMLRCAPGLSVFADLGTDAPIRGARNVEGTLLVVSADKLFRMDKDGSPYIVGRVPGVKRVSMAHNQITGGNEVAISNGSSGYVYNTRTNKLEQITDDGFPGASSFEYCDSYILGIEPGRRFAFNSSLADAMEYSDLDRYEAESSPDLLVGQIVNHRDWWLMGERTIEIFANTGAEQGTFQRTTGSGMEKGLASPFAVANMDNTVYWLGSDGIVYRAVGFTPQRVSTYPIEQAIARSNMSSAFAFVFEDRGHKIFYLTFPDGHTWGYDVSTQEWHRRSSRDLTRWRINTLTNWRGRWIAGDYVNGRLYELDWDVQTEAGIPMERRRTTGVLSDADNALIVNAVKLILNTGMPAKPAVEIVVSIAGDVPDGYVSKAIDSTYAARGGSAPYTFQVISGLLPPGLTMNTAGHVTGTPTQDGIFRWTVKVTDAEGQTATLGDMSSIAPVLGAQLTGWKWLQTTLDDVTNYSDPLLSDAAWQDGHGPFGNLTENDGGVGIAAHAYDSRFKATINTQTQLNERAWIRRHFHLDAVPVNGYKLIGYFDNSVVIYVNGVETFNGSTETASGVTKIIPGSYFAEGDNVLAVRCDDGAVPIPNQGSYFDFLLDPVP